MSEGRVIGETDTPSTRASLRRDLRTLGLESGTIVIVHASLSSLGWVCGGAVAVVQALLDAVGDEGTLVMPSHSSDYSDPASWGNPPVPRDWWQLIRDEMPAFEASTTPTRGLGRVAEAFRSFPGVVRSAHPAMSFCAKGARANEIVDAHELDFSLGEGSPLARLYELDAKVLLLGVGHDKNTSLHLAEYRAAIRPGRDCGAPVVVGGERVWRTYRDIAFDEVPFVAIGRAFEEQARVRCARVGNIDARLFSQREIVDIAVRLLRKRT